MSERKTTEIKLRVTPAEKSAWQLAAEDEGIGLSELIRREMNARASQLHECLERRREAGISHERTPEGIARSVETAMSLAGSHPEGDLFPIAPTSVGNTTSQEDVPTSDAESRVAKPWMFEARNGE